jgi:hypothetical protein
MRASALRTFVPLALALAHLTGCLLAIEDSKYRDAATSDGSTVPGDGALPDGSASDGSASDGGASDATPDVPCPAGYVRCGEACVDAANDPRNCGGCDVACPTVASGSVACHGGRCVLTCPDGRGDCNGAIADGCESDLHSVQHCGSCDVGCASSGTGQAVCTPDTSGRYACGAACGAATPTLCNGTCADLRADPQHCGACDLACASGQVCAAGVCACPSNESLCGSPPACVDTASNASHCGGCGQACPSGFVCAGGACRCPPDLARCGSSAACIDLQTDPNHCGTCDTACPSGACVAGHCAPCAAGTTMCPGDARCVDLSADTFHCGTCDIACPAGLVCRLGHCGCPPGQVLLGRVCMACGGPGQPCCPAGAAATPCASGTCNTTTNVCPPAPCDGGPCMMAADAG